MKQSYVYILASGYKGTLYVGVTSNLIKRVYEHRNNFVKGFTSNYNVHRLVYYEISDDMMSAIAREKQIKKYKRQWKLNMINSMNPNWLDLYETLV